MNQPNQTKRLSKRFVHNTVLLLVTMMLTASIPGHTSLQDSKASETKASDKASAPTGERVMPDRLALLSYQSGALKAWKGLGVIEGNPPRLMECFSYVDDPMLSRLGLENVGAAPSTPLSFWELSRGRDGGNAQVTLIDWQIMGGRQWSLELTSNDVHSLCAVDAGRFCAVLLRKDGDWYIGMVRKDNRDVVRTLVADHGVKMPFNADVLPMLVVSRPALAESMQDHILIIRRDEPRLYGLDCLGGTVRSIASLPLPFCPDAATIVEPTNSLSGEPPQLYVAGNVAGQLRMARFAVNPDGISGREITLPSNRPRGGRITSLDITTLMIGVPTAVIGYQDAELAHVLYLSRGGEYPVLPFSHPAPSTCRVQPFPPVLMDGAENDHWLFAPFTTRQGDHSLAVLVAVSQAAEMTFIKRPGRTAGLVRGGQTLLWYIRGAEGQGVDCVIPIDANTLSEGQPLRLGITSGNETEPNRLIFQAGDRISQVR